jgi:hypothetical protein
VHHRYQRLRWQICHRFLQHQRQIAAGINNTGGKFATSIPVSMTPAANFATSFASVVDTSGKFALSCEYLREFRTMLVVLSEAWGTMIHENNLKRKFS